jgi:oligopeptide/dipeptide ABC transporter ATP-binding protein
VSDELLQIEKVSHAFTSRRGLLRGTSSTLALDDVSISIAPGESLALVGESGSGKTTLGRVVAALLRPTAGQVRLDGVPLANRNRTDMLRYRRDVQMIFQNTQHAFNPRRTVRSILSDPYEIHGLPTPNGRDAALAELMEQVGLRAAMLDRYPHQFSGGQRQRIGIARALSLRPRLIVADEPVSALDVSVQAQVLNLFAQLRRELGLSLLFISHDLRAVYFLCERIAVIYRGRLVEVAPRERLLTRPRHPYSQCLISAVPSLSAKDQGLVEAPLGAPAESDVGEPREPVKADAVGCHYVDRCDLYAQLGRPEKCRTSRPELVWATDSSAAACHFAPDASSEDDADGEPVTLSVAER